MVNNNNSNQEKKPKVFFFCDICNGQEFGEPTRMYVDAPYLPHIDKRSLSKVCNSCLLKVVATDDEIINPNKDKSWFK